MKIGRNMEESKEYREVSRKARNIDESKEY